jgi:hypothetical protein
MPVFPANPIFYRLFCGRFSVGLQRIPFFIFLNCGAATLQKMWIAERFGLSQSNISIKLRGRNPTKMKKVKKGDTTSPAVKKITSQNVLPRINSN